jgi:hypothetical protein
MEDTKLTIRIPQDVLDGAKHYARRNQTTLTRLVSEYLRRLTIEEDPLRQAPIVQRLAGTLSPNVTVADYWEYLEEKYGSRAQGTD